MKFHFYKKSHQSGGQLPSSKTHAPTVSGSVISYQLSVISYQLSVFCDLKFIGDNTTWSFDDRFNEKEVPLVLKLDPIFIPFEVLLF